ncbi:MAG TPA: hypothetical protein VNJ50_08830 [Gelidibacter sp.]|uniref:hypothetical protein n=1 Tax=Gelidibacter sp. TaxID=2018083 RepID=UPI002C67C25A|nr:hypothetical protein [Gelidibacter sp.]HXJ98937.1 hypothetical protein [Gelidibacter sp.]
MARQKGIVKLDGTLGGVNFYKREGEHLARVSGGGFNSESIKRSALMRGNSSEMGLASVVNKVFKQSFRSLWLDKNYGSVHYRLQSLFMEIKNLDEVSVFGKRCVAEGMATDYGKRLLKDFRFQEGSGVLLSGKLAFDWTTPRMTVSGFDMERMELPDGVDLLGVQLLTVCFDFETLDFSFQLSGLLELFRDFGDDHFSLETAPLNASDPGVRYAMLRLAHYQQVNGTNYLMRGDAGIRYGFVSVV